MLLLLCSLTVELCLVLSLWSVILMKNTKTCFWFTCRVILISKIWVESLEHYLNWVTLLQVPLKRFSVCVVVFYEQEDIFFSLKTIAEHMYITAHVDNLVQVARYIRSIRFSLHHTSLRLQQSTGEVTDPDVLSEADSTHRNLDTTHSFQHSLGGSYSVPVPPTYLQSCVTWLVESSALAWNISRFALLPHRLRFMITVVRTEGRQRGKQWW